jgi:hypothetical protein
MPRVTRQQDLIMRVLAWPTLCTVLILIAISATLRLTHDRIVIAAVPMMALFSVLALLRTMWRMIQREIDQRDCEGRS